MPSSTSAIRAGRAYVELFADGRKLYAGLKQASLKLKAFGSSVREVGSKLMMIGSAALAPLAAVAKLYGSMGDQLAHMSARTGIAVEVLSALSFAAQQSGVDVEELEKGIRKMQKTIVSAATGSQGAVDALGRLGLTVRDLDGLKPDAQLSLIAERLSQIADPTIRAAMAMEIFGRSGTQLLPLLSLGADGMARLEDQARRLGLVISTEDAEAAHKFNRLLETLWDLVKRAGFALGGALAPALSEVAKWLGGAVMALTEWISNNREAVVLALKVAAGIVAAGAALVGLGTALGFVGRAMGSVFTIVSGVSSVFSTLGTILGALLSPIGLVIAGVVALGGYILYASGAGVKAVNWLAKSFGSLLADVQEAVSGIGDALASGDIALAAKILWLTLKMLWVQGTSALAEVWYGVKDWFVGVFRDAWDGVRVIFFAVCGGLEEGWINFTSFLSKTWVSFTAWLHTAWNDVSAWFEQQWNKLKGLFDSDFDVEAANKSVDAERDRLNQELERARNEKLAAREKERAGEEQTVQKKWTDRITGVGQENIDAERKRKEDLARKLQQNEEEVKAARKEWQDSIDTAKAKRKAKEAAGEGVGAMEPPDDLLEKAKKAVGNLGDLMEATAKRTIGAAGTFNAAALLGLQAGGMDDRVANATERTAKGVDALRQDVRNNKAAFV